MGTSDYDKPRWFGTDDSLGRGDELFPAEKGVECGKQWLTQRIEALRPSATEEVDREVKQMRHAGINDIVSLGVGEPCFDTPQNIKEASCKALMDGETKYQPTGGAYVLREAICSKLARENGIHISVDEVLVTAGAKFAIYLVFQATLQQGDRVMLLDPAWVSYEAAALMAGADVVRVPTNAGSGFQPDFGMIEKAIDKRVKIIVVNSPCNPTGAVFPRQSLSRLAKIAREAEALLLSDEVYEYQLYDGEHYSPGADYDNVITVNAFSKSHAMTGWRLGYVTGPPDVLEGMTKIYQHSTSCVTAFAQYGAVEALQSAASRMAVTEMREGYRRRGKLMVTLINESEAFQLKYPPTGAFYCFPSYQAEISSVELATRLLREVHVATVPGIAFGANGEGHLRLSYATSEEDITEAFRRMAEFFGRL
jgi:aspartate aminotransferase